MDAQELQNSISMTNATWSLTIATWVLAIVAFAGIIFTFIQLRIERRWRRGEHLAKFREMFEGESLSRHRRKLAQGRLVQIRSGIPLTYENAPAASWRVLDFIEALCREVDEDRLSLEDIWSEYSEWISLYKHDFAGAIVELRRVRGDNTYYSSLYSIYERINQLCRDGGMPLVEFSAKDVQDFYEVDAEN